MRRRIAFVLVVLVSVGFVATAPSAPAASPGTRWTRQLSADPFGVAGDRVGYAVTVQPDEVVAFDRRGHELWHTVVGRVALGTRPAIDPTTVLVATENAHMALNRNDGSIRWTRAFAEATTSTLYASPGGPGACVASLQGVVACVDAGRGLPRWSVTYPGVVVTAPIVHPSGVVVAAWQSDDGVGALRVLDLATGALRWQVPLLVRAAAPAVTGDVVIEAQGDGNYNARAEAFDLATGASRWAAPLPASFEFKIEPTTDGRLFVTVDHFGRASALDVATGRLAWQVATRRALVGTRVTLTDREVIFAVYLDTLFILDRASGRILQKDVRHGVVIDHLVVDRDLVVALRLFGRLVSTPLP